MATRSIINRLRELADTAAVLSSSLPLPEMIQLVAEKARHIVPARLASCSLSPDPRQAQPSTALSVADKGVNERALARQLENFGFSIRLGQAERPLRLEQAALEANPVWCELAQQVGERMRLQNWMAVPLKRRDGLSMGHLLLAGRVEGDFTAEDESLLVQLSHLAALAAENEWLSRAEQHARQVAETLRVANLALAQELSLDSVLETLLDYLGWIVPYDCASVLLLDGQAQLSVRAMRSYDQQKVAHRRARPLYNIQLDVILNDLYTTRRSLLISDTHSQPGWEQHFGSHNRSWLALPLISDERLIGLCLVEKAEPGFFTEEHLRVAEALAAQAVVAIQNASLFERLRQSEERYRAATELTSDYAYALRLEPDGQIVREWVTDAFTRITGFAADEMDARGGLISLIHHDDVPIANRHMQTLLSGQVSVSEFRIVTRREEIRWLRDYSRPVWDGEQKRVVRVYGAAQDITERKQHERELEAVAVIASALRTAPTHTSMLPIILDQTLKLLNAEGAALALRDSVTTEIVVELGRGEWAGWMGLRHPEGEGVSGHVIGSGQAYRNNDALNDPLRARAEQIGDLRAVACVPLIAQEQTIGALWIGRRTDILETEVRLLTAIADIAANALRRATLYEQTEQRLQHITALRSIDRAITASLDLQVTLNILLDQATTQLVVHAADILLFDAATQSLDYHAGRGFRSTAVARTHLRLGEGFAGRAALDRRILRLPNLPDSDPNDTIAPLLAGEGFVTCYCVPLVTKGQLKGVLEVFHRAPLNPDPEWFEFMETLAGQAAIAIENAQLFDGLQRTNLKLTQAYDATIEGWSRALELRDKETEGHSHRVTEMTLRLARAMEMSETEMVHVRRGTLLHDIGKMGIPDAILLRPGPLTDAEWQIMRLHPKYAYDMLSPIDYLRPALDIPYCHHEKWDGSGYPRGLKGEQIPLAARIFAIADVWDALSSDRPYGQAWSKDKVLEHVRQEAGGYFDPKVVEAFLRMMSEL